MKLLNRTCLLLLLIFHPCAAQEIDASTAVLDYAHSRLSPCGILKDSSGFIYVDIDDAYIHELIPFIQKAGFVEPPYFGSEELVGAHITVVYPDEVKKYEIGVMEECGKTIYFTPKACQIVNPPKWKDQIYLMVVEAPELDRIRKKYGLPKREYAFHITIGIRCKAA